MLVTIKEEIESPSFMLVCIQIHRFELADGQLNGSAGCNLYFANYKLENEQLMVDKAGSPKRFCGEPGVMEQESTYLSLLQQADNAIAVTGNSLTIETSEGNLVFEAAS